MPDLLLCKICGKRRARRACPAVHGDICTLCCGTEREVSLSCPLECPYLQDAHQHEKAIPVPDTDVSNPDIAVTEQFLQSHEELLVFCIFSLLQAALRTPGAVDSDVLAALEALIQTRRTLESGLVYETRAQNAIAASVQRSFSASLADYQKLGEDREGLSRPRPLHQSVSAASNAEIMAVLVFLHRIGQQTQNGRPRGRMYLDLLRHMTPDPRVEERAPSITL